MKIVVLCGLCALLLPSFAHAVNPANCSNTAVQAAIDATATGGTVIVPAGNCTWTTRVIIQAKALTLTGATVCSGSPVTCTDNTNITDQTTGTVCFNSSGCALTVIQATATNFVNVSGFTFIKSVAHGGGLVQIAGTGVSFRFHHNHILQATSGARGMAVLNGYGLIDHNFFEVTSASGSIQSIQIIGSSAASDAGYTPWQQPLTMGTDKAVYLEDNTITYNTGDTGVEDSLDAYSGARFVVRYNRINNIAMGHHGTDSGNQRSPVSFEVYNNIFTNNSTVVIRAWTIRGGTGVFFNNTYTGSVASWNPLALAYYRACIFISQVAAWGINGCDGTQYVMGSSTFSNTASRYACDITTNPVPGLGGCAAFPSITWVSNNKFCSGDPETMCTADSSCAAAGKGTCTRYLDGSGTGGYPGRDQPGRGPGQVLEPLYAWNNTGSTGFGVIVDPGGCQLGLPSSTWLLAGRDFYNDNTTVRPGYTAYTYPHPLAGPPDTTLPAAPTGFTVSQLERK